MQVKLDFMFQGEKIIRNLLWVFFFLEYDSLQKKQSVS